MLKSTPQKFLGFTKNYSDQTGNVKKQPK